jgi:MFS family permease
MWIAIPAIAAFGFCVSSAGISIQSIIQLSTDRNMRGRVMGLYGVIFRGAPALGALIAGSASTYLGLRWPIVAGATIVIAACLWAYGRRAAIGNGLSPPRLIPPDPPGDAAHAAKAGQPP